MNTIMLVCLYIMIFLMLLKIGVILEDIYEVLQSIRWTLNDNQKQNKNKWW